MNYAPFVELLNISKSFPGVKALTDISAKFFRGRVHVLLGENGAGKSTVIKIISGVYQADNGRIIVNGSEQRFTNTRESLAHGISVIHQELSVIPDLTVAENIFLGREPKKSSGFIDKKKMYDDTRTLFETIGVEIDPKAYIRKLNNGDKQMVEIAKAVSQNSSMVIMDEPTSSLSEREVSALFRVIRRLKADNVAVIYISHRLKEILEIGDDITVLRDGTLVTTRPISGMTEKEMVALMVGREMTQFYYRAENAVKDEIVLEVRNLTRKGAFEDVSFELKRGEVLGVSGLVGAGRTEVMRAVYGADSYDSGTIKLFGNEVHLRSCEEAIAMGIGLVPEDRRNQGLMLEKSVKENTSIASLKSHSKRGFIDFAWEKASAVEYIEKLRTKTPSENTTIKNLSGGNQQKVVIARWLLAQSKILIMDEPTRGIDVNTKAEIYNLMKAFVEEGGSIIMVSSELPEILGVSDRIMVMSEGRVTGILDISEASEKKIMSLASEGVLKNGTE